MVFTALQMSNVWNGVCEENFYELIGSFISSILVAIDTGVMVWAKWPIAKDVQVIFLLVAAVTYLIVVLSLGMPLYKVLIRRMHRKIGSDPKTQGIYKHHLLTLTLLKFSACFSIISIVCAGEGLFNVEDGSVGVWRFVGAVICVILAMAWSFLGWYALSNERKPLAILYLVGFIMSPIYCVVWFVYSPYKGNTQGKRLLVVFFVIYACMSLVLHLCTFIASIKRYKLFGLGLAVTLKSEKLRRRNEGRADEGFADLDSDEEFDLDVTFDTNPGVNYQRMEDE